MLTFALAGVLIVIGLLLLLGRVGDTDGKGAFAFFAVIAILSIAVRGFGSYTAQLWDFSDVKQKKNEIRLFMERRDNLAVLVKTELAKYPEYEKKIIGGITPNVLLQFPNLKSNETIVKTAESLVKFEDAIYELRLGLIKTHTSIYYREISPWVFYVTPYEKFFGEKNPIAENK